MIPEDDNETASGKLTELPLEELTNKQAQRNCIMFITQHQAKGNQIILVESMVFK